jgi:FkbM family methyltransferase
MIGSRCGFDVRAFEPDPVHFEQLEKNIRRNIIKEDENRFELHNSAVSIEDGIMNFCRVSGNTTSSHITGSKANRYGKFEYFDVDVENALKHIEWVDLVKMDVEGHEAVILCETDIDHWRSTDAIVEIENAENAAKVFEHFSRIKVNLFAQKIGWGKVQACGKIPCGYKEGSLFISCKPEIPWV